LLNSFTENGGEIDKIFSDTERDSLIKEFVESDDFENLIMYISAFYCYLKQEDYISEARNQEAPHNLKSLNIDVIDIIAIEGLRSEINTTSLNNLFKEVLKENALIEVIKSSQARPKTDVQRPKVERREVSGCLKKITNCCVVM